MEIGPKLQRLSSWFKPPEKYIGEAFEKATTSKAGIQGLFTISPEIAPNFNFEFLDKYIGSKDLEQIITEQESHKEIQKKLEEKDKTQLNMYIDGAEIPHYFGYQHNFHFALYALQNLFTLAVNNGKVLVNDGSTTLDKIDSRLSKNIILAWKIHQPDTPQEKAHIALKNKTNGDLLNITLKSDNNSKKEDIGQVLAAMTDPEKPNYSLESATKYSEGHEWQMDGKGNLSRDGLGFIKQVDTKVTVEKSDQNGFEDLPPGDDFDPADWWKNL